MSTKNSTTSRRAFLGAAGGALGASFVLLGPRPLHAALDELTRTKLNDRLSVISGAGCNIVVLETEDGLALVDSGAAAQTDALLDFVDREYGGAPIRVLFNTHWHETHTGGNEAIARRGATIIAHENTRLWMSTEYYVEWEDRNYTPRPEAAWPTKTFYASDPQPLSYELGGVSIEYGQLAEAHTDGDIYVRFPEDNVIAVGDVLAVDAFPLLDYSTGGWIGGAQGATQRLIELTNDQTLIIAGDGPPQNHAALEAQLALLDELRERIRVRIIAGKSVDEIFAEAADVFAGYESLPNPRQFVHNVYNGLWWGGRLRGAY